MTIELTANDIYEKKFKNAITGGYSKNDVDEYLDIIIQDYEKFEQRVNQLEAEIDRLKQSETKKVEQASNVQNTQLHANYDVLKRISNLEKAVFGQKLNES